jgi:hypothetical protein
MFFLASCAAFCRSAKLGSLNPLIDQALSFLVCDELVGPTVVGRAMTKTFWQAMGLRVVAF